MEKEVRTAKWTIVGCILGVTAIAVSVMLHVAGMRQSEAMKVYERGSEANVKIEAQRLAEKWRQEDAQRSVAPPTPPRCRPPQWNKKHRAPLRGPFRYEILLPWHVLSWAAYPEAALRVRRRGRTKTSNEGCGT
jgi:hypothetical protein